MSDLRVMRGFAGGVSATCGNFAAYNRAKTGGPGETPPATSRTSRTSRVCRFRPIVALPLKPSMLSRAGRGAGVVLVIVRRLGRYGASNATLMQWIAACGGPVLLAERAASQPCGRRAGGAVAINKEPERV